MKKILGLILLVTSTLTYGQCTEQSNFISDIKINRQTLNIHIKPKNNENFSYYDLRGAINEKYIGFKFILGKAVIRPIGSIDDHFRYSSGVIGLVPQTTINNAMTVLIDDNRIISTMLDQGNYSGQPIVPIPLAENTRKTTNEFSKIINIPSFIQIYRKMLQYNDIYGKHKIKFYITLIHSNDVSKCATFESPEMIYDFGNYYIEQAKNFISPIVSPIWIVFKRIFGKEHNK